MRQKWHIGVAKAKYCSNFKKTKPCARRYFGISSNSTGCGKKTQCKAKISQTIIQHLRFHVVSLQDGLHGQVAQPGVFGKVLLGAELVLQHFGEISHVLAGGRLQGGG